MRFPFCPQSTRYTLLLDSSSKTGSRILPWALTIPLGIVCTVVGLIAGLAIRRDDKSLPEWDHLIHRVPTSWSQQIFAYNGSFGAAPSADGTTEEIWDSIVPQGQGFVLYPGGITPKSALSVVHQLHCLYSIRRGYYAAVDGEIHPKGPHAPAHVRHCFDYLRQGLMCNADSSLEPEHADLDGVTGWGFPRRCHDYEQLKQWAEKWRSNDRRGFREGIYPVSGKADVH